MSDNRQYMDTHPWITFKLDLSDHVPYDLWILLGAVESKCKHLTGIPLRPEKRDELNRIWLRKGVHATTAIEGNSLSEEEVQAIIDKTDTKFPLSKEYQKKEVENVVDEYNKIVEGVHLTGDCDASYKELLEDNRAILNGLQLDKGIAPGKLRYHSVVVNRYRGAPAEDCDYLLHRLFDWLHDESYWHISEGHDLIGGIIKAIIAHLYVAWIHPFGDGNGRSARMLEFRLLMAAGVPLNAAHLLTSHYNNTRTEYYNVLAATSQSPNGNPAVFLLYALQGFFDALDGQIKDILKEQLDVTWTNYVHQHPCFKGRLTTSRARQRDLLLGLSSFEKFMAPDELRRRLKEDILKQYDTKTSKTFKRDLNDLARAGLVIKADTHFLAAKRLVRAFMPLCKRDA